MGTSLREGNLQTGRMQWETTQLSFPWMHGNYTYWQEEKKKMTHHGKKEIYLILIRNYMYLTVLHPHVVNTMGKYRPECIFIMKTKYEKVMSLF